MSIERVILVAAALYGLFQIMRAFRSGAAAEDGRIRRDERPVLYWTLMALAVLLVAIFLYFAAFGDFS